MNETNDICKKLRNERLGIFNSILNKQMWTNEDGLKVSANNEEMFKNKCCDEEYQVPLEYKNSFVCIDNDIVNPIKKLWDMGYQTKWSCSGTSMHKESNAFKSGIDLRTDSYITLSLGDIDKKTTKISDNELIKWYNKSGGISNVGFEVNTKTQYYDLIFKAFNSIYMDNAIALLDKSGLDMENVEINNLFIIIKDYAKINEDQINKISCLSDALKKTNFNNIWLNATEIFDDKTDLRLTVHFYSNDDGYSDTEIVDNWNSFVKNLEDANCNIN